jgi:hypothetical protein
MTNPAYSLNSPIYSSFGVVDQSANPTNGIWLGVSTSTSNVYWRSIPWNVDYCDPEDEHFPELGGLTILYGPAMFDLDAGIRLMLQQPGASCHIRTYAAKNVDDVDTRMQWNGGESFEWFVGPGETGNTHVNGHWKGWLPENYQLRVEVDYWHATSACRIVGGTARLFAWRNYVPEVI